MARSGVAFCAVLLVLAAGVAPAHGGEGDVLPDLDQMVPGNLVVKKRMVGGRRCSGSAFPRPLPTSAPGR